MTLGQKNDPSASSPNGLRCLENHGDKTLALHAAGGMF